MLKVDIESQEDFTKEQLKKLEELRTLCAASVIEMTTVAGCGHPGGSLSSLDILLVIYSSIRQDPKSPADPDRDRVFISHGHISPGVYATLGAFGYFDLNEGILLFRRAGSPYGGHVEHFVPGVEWNTGNLGQGLSAAVGSALAAKLKRKDYRTICCMGDGEQQKGQISEARRFAVKEKLSNLLVFVDWNGLQIGGAISDVMPQNLYDEWKAAGWNVILVEDGHNFSTLYRAFRKAYLRKTKNPERPTVILAKTVMGKGIPFIEGDAKYHGKALSLEQAEEAMKILGRPFRIPELIQKRQKLPLKAYPHQDHTFLPPPKIHIPPPVVYSKDQLTDCRSAYGRVLKDLAEANNQGGVPKVLGLTCDLESSVKMTDFRQVSPQAFFECGIQEHHTAVMSGRLSKEGFVVFFSTFGVFGGSEVYNQQRLNDFNGTHLKVVVTHCGLDVGEDGPTHQCIDFIGLFSHFFSFSLFFPADPNQCDRIIRYVASQPGNFLVAMGRSKLPVLTKEQGGIFFDESYQFIPGRGDILREGKDGTIIAFGPALHNALKAWELLGEKGIRPRLVNMASLKPVDRELIVASAKQGPILTVEDHHVETGLGSIVAKVLLEEGVHSPLVRLGVSRYGFSGKPKEVYQLLGLDPDSIAKTFQKLWENYSAKVK